MTNRTYNQNEQQKVTFYKTLKEAMAKARAINSGNPWGDEYEAVKALDLYTGDFIGYTVEHK